MFTSWFVPKTIRGMLLRAIISSLIVLFFCSLTFLQVKENNLRALCIGVNSREVTDKGIDCPFNRDAIVIHEMLKDKLIDSRLVVGTEATVNNVYYALYDMAVTSSDNDVNLILFSTHGSLTKKEQEFYVGLNKGRLYAREFVPIINKMRGIVIIVADTCHSGELLNCAFNDNVIVFASCKSEQSASWMWLEDCWDYEPCGFLTRPIWRALSGQSDYDHNGRLEVFEIVMELLLEENQEIPDIKDQKLVYRIPDNLYRFVIK